MKQKNLKETNGDQWEQCLVNANSFDQVKSVIENWRADESALDPDPNGTNIVVSMMNAIETGDIPLIKYLLEQGVSLRSTVGLWAVGHSPKEKRVEILEPVYEQRHANSWVSPPISLNRSITNHCFQSLL